MHRIAVPVTEGVPTFELGIPCEVFGRRRADFPAPWWYDLRLCSAGPVATADGLRLDSPYGLDDIVTADTVIVPPLADVPGDPPPELLEALRSAYARGARIASMCTGAFTLAAAGLLDDRPATTHWHYAEEFARRWPRVKLDTDVLYTGDERVYTSAGVAAGLDLCLHLVREDHGTRIANALARRLVMPPHRDGGQAQYIETSVRSGTEPTPMSAVLDWTREHLDEPLTVEELAARATMSPRTFARAFRATTATTPLQWLLGERIRLAQELLECTDDTIERVAVRCGFGSAHQLRTHFVRAHRVTPYEFRRMFRA
ncbi:MAG TPA: helix-turn-helix domain-containing protein [Micromonosporaceae bacterium]|jgi:transcriptional regulator GlxA family with amidase domain